LITLFDVIQGLTNAIWVLHSGAVLRRCLHIATKHRMRQKQSGSVLTCTQSTRVWQRHRM